MQKRTLKHEQRTHNHTTHNTQHTTPSPRTFGSIHINSVLHRIPEAASPSTGTVPPMTEPLIIDAVIEPDKSPAPPDAAIDCSSGASHAARSRTWTLNPNRRNPLCSYGLLRGCFKCIDPSPPPLPSTSPPRRPPSAPPSSDASRYWLGVSSLTSMRGKRHSNACGADSSRCGWNTTSTLRHPATLSTRSIWRKRTYHTEQRYPARQGPTWPYYRASAKRSR